MPANAGVKEVHPRSLKLVGQVHHFAPVAAMFDQIHQRQAKADDEILWDGGAYAFDDAKGKAAAARGVATPFIHAQIGQGRQELVNQIALATHDFHAVVARITGQGGAAHIVGNDLLDLLLAQFPRAAVAELGLHTAGRYAATAMVIAAHMQHLHEDVAAFGVNGIGNQAVSLRLLGRAQGGELCMLGHAQRIFIDAKAAGNDELQPFACPFCIEHGQLFKATILILQPCMHGAHQNAILQGEMTNGDGLKKMGVHG